MRGHVKKVSIVELDHGYAVCGLKNFRMLYWIDYRHKRYAVCELYARAHRQNSQLNTLVWGLHTLDQLCRVLYRGEPGKSLNPNLGNNIN